MAAARRVKWRTALPIAAVALVVVSFLLRLISLQVVDAPALNSESADRREGVTTLFGTRGQIVDANGTVLANSVDRFDIEISPMSMADYELAGQGSEPTKKVTIDDVFTAVASTTGQDAATLRAGVDAMLANDPQTNFAYLARMVTLDQYDQIKNLHVPWMYFERHAQRTYPNGAVAGNLVGFLGEDGEPLAGLELGQNACVAGQDGEEHYLRSGDGVAIPGSAYVDTPAVQGGQLQLTIDSDVQWRTQQIIAEQVMAMGAESGTISVLDVKRSEIMAVAEYPTVDPNDPAGVDPEFRGSTAFTAPFEPGSIMKPITAASLFDAGMVSPTDTEQVPDHFAKNGADFNDDSPHPVTTMNMNGVITESSNVGISMFGERLSAEERYNYLKKFGFGETTSVDFPGQEAGTVRPASEWDAQTFYTEMFGQGVTVTVPQMLGAFQAVANGGNKVPLSLSRGCLDAQGELQNQPDKTATSIISSQAASDTLTAMEANGRAGWLHSKVEIPGYRLGIKTGTAQFADPETGAYVRGKYVTSMVGVAPIDDPQYVVLVTMRNPVTMTNSGSTAAAWQQTMSYVLQKERVAPSAQPWPDIEILH